MRHLLRADPAVVTRRSALWPVVSGSVPTGHRAKLRALVDFYAGDATRYLNFFGPPGTFQFPYTPNLPAGAPMTCDLFPRVWPR